MYQEARNLIDNGIVVLPAYRKSPVGDWRKYQDLRPQEIEYARWFRNETPMWILTGAPSRLIILDCDNEAATELWRSLIGDEMDRTTMVTTYKGAHYWFRLPEDVMNSPTQHVGKKNDQGEPHYDILGDGSGAMAPPSPHPDGGRYEFARGIDHLIDAPALLWDPKLRPRIASGVGGDAEVRSMLTDLLQNPPDEGGRNVWLTQVAGHLATNVRYKDAYEALMDWVNNGLSTPIEIAELRKTLESVWRTESNKASVDKREAWDERTGYLVAKDGRLYTMCREEDSGNQVFVAHPVTNFDLVTRGRILSEDESIRYRVDLVMENKTVPLTFDPAKVTTPAELRRYFYPYGCTFTQPAGDIYRTTALYDRIVSYVVSQETSLVREIPHLGWLPGVGYVTHETVLTADGGTPVIDAGVAPATVLRQWAPYYYGVGNPDTAKEVLREVLTFHDELVCAVFGSWWATLPLKAQITEQTALFPFMAIEAPSESGKTTGFFSLMIALNGSTEGHGEFTTAALRDRASAHRNGIVWIDDVSDTYSVFEIIRQATSEGSRSKKGVDRTSQETVQMVSPIVLTGEGLSALENEKALKDRAIQLQVGSPTGRVSRRDPVRSQWEDIVLLRQRYPNLAEFAGDLVVESLRRENMVRLLPELRIGSGRHADKLAIVRLGSRVLSDILDDTSYVERVDSWAEQEADSYNRDDNYLLLRVIPAYIDDTSIVQDSAVGGPAVFVRSGQVWFSEAKLASWWEKRGGLTERDRSLGSKSSLTAQCKKLPGIESRRWSVIGKRPRGVSDQQVVYRGLSEEASRLVLERSGRGRDEQDVLHG